MFPAHPLCDTMSHQTLDEHAAQSMLCTGPSAKASCLSPSWWPVSEHLSGVLWAPNSVFCSLHVLETKAPGLMNLQASNKHEREREKKQIMISYFTSQCGWVGVSEVS